MADSEFEFTDDEEDQFSLSPSPEKELDEDELLEEDLKDPVLKPVKVESVGSPDPTPLVDDKQLEELLDTTKAPKRRYPQKKTETLNPEDDELLDLIEPEKREKKKKGKKEKVKYEVNYKPYSPNLKGYENVDKVERVSHCVICGKEVDDIDSHALNKHPIIYYNFLLPHCTCETDGKPTLISVRAEEYFNLIRKYDFPETMKRMGITRMCCRSKFAAPVALPMIDRNKDRFNNTIDGKKHDTKEIIIHNLPLRPVLEGDKLKSKKKDKRRDAAPDL